MTNCVFRYCKNTSRNLTVDSDISFHRFVHSGHAKREEWLQIVRRDRSEDTWLPTKYSFVCSAHFRPADIYTTATGKRFLTKTAIPLGNVSEPYRNASPISLYSSENPVLIVDPPCNTKMKNDVQKEIREKYIKSQRRNKCLPTKKTFTEIVKTLKYKFGLSEEIEIELLNKAKVVEMYTKTLLSKRKSRKKLKYSCPPSIRKFALTCYYYSPAAYKYVRIFFPNALPLPRTLSKWYGSINAEPGFTQKSFKKLKLKSDSTNKLVICSLIFGEMELRKQKLFKHEKLGLVNFGDCPVEGQEKANKVLVFMLVSMTENWKIPVGYFLAADISADAKASLIRICLKKCSDVGVLVPSVTFDGCPVNFQAVEKLGCDFSDVDNLKSYFIHPSTADKVYVFVDPCHVIKLIRNTFENKILLYDKDDQLLKWQLLMNLAKLQQSQGLNFVNKLSSPRYMHFRNQIMNVKLGIQSLSRSVANALILCNEELKSSQFQNSEGTVQFIAKMNCLFDVLNSQSCHFYGYKRPLDRKNMSDIFNFLDDAKKYISGLQFHVKQRRQLRVPNKKPLILLHISMKQIVKSNDKIGFVGALICIESLKGLYSMLVDKSVIKHLSAYRLSLDHLELLFGCIRRHSGGNKPNVLQYRAAYKDVLRHLKLLSPFTGNDIPLDNFTIMISPSVDVINNTTKMNRYNEEEFQILENEKELDSDRHAKTNCMILADLLNVEQDITSMKLIVGYISGYAARNLIRELKCEECISSLVTSFRSWHHKLIQLKDMGGLCYSTKEVYTICFKTETVIRNLIKYKGHGKILHRGNISIVCNTLKTFVMSDIFNTLNTHSLQQPCTLNHRTHMIRAVIEQYALIRLHYEPKMNPEVNYLAKRTHPKPTKLILF